MTLLLVDDDPDQLELRSLTLAQAGFKNCTACDVETAIRLAAQESPDVAVVDLRLPTIEAGVKLIRDLKKLDKHMRVIVLTGADPKKLEKLAERSMLEAVFTKGYASRQLVAHLKESVGFELRHRLAQEGQLVIEVKVIPRSAQSEISEFLADGSLRVKLRALPEKGAANDELIGLLAQYFSVRKDAVEFLTGGTSQRKRLRIRKTKAT